MKPAPLLLTCLIGLAVPMVGLAQPTITVQPQSQTNVVGTDATFTVTASGTMPLAYQWQWGVSGYFYDRTDCTNTTLVLTNVGSSDALDYRVIVTNVDGAITSDVATLTVIVPPTNAKVNPTNSSVSLGANVTMRVTAGGTPPLGYQWCVNGTALSGQTKNPLSLTNVQSVDAGAYAVVVTNVAGAVTSQVATLSVDPTFTKITSGAIVTDRGLFTSSSWADYDNDGFLDLLVGNFDTGNFLYHNNRDGTFSRINTAPIATDPEHTIRCAWADYDNDGLLDFVAFNGGSSYWEANALYHNNGDGTFSRMAAGAVGVLASDKGNCHGGAWGDFNNDGLLDLLVVSWSGKVVLYRNNPDGRFTKVGAGPLVNFGPQSTGCAWADFNNDGWIDVFVAGGYGGGNCLFRNDGHGAFIAITGRVPSSDAASSDGVAWGDYDNDGYLDLFVTDFESGGNRLYRNKGDGTFQRITSGAIVADRKGSTGCAWGDYDNDGFLDLFVVNGFAGPENNLLYHNNGDGTFSKITSGSPVNDGGTSFGVGWGDYDNDGFLDLFVANGLRGPPQSNFLYRNNGNSNAWIRIKCVGTASNRAGFGAKVRVRATIAGQSRWQMRQIDGGDGTSGGSLEAHFGLGDATVIDTVRIEWPSGIVQELHDVAPKQFLTVTEPTRLQSRGAGVLRIQSWKGMAFEVQASTDLNQWSPMTTVTNLTGTLEFTDPDTTNSFRRFYRTVVR
jgi:hypothetical protein